MKELIQLNWVPLVGMDFALDMGPSNLFFSSLVIIIGIGVYLYGYAYTKNYSSHKRIVFFSSLTVFTMAMLGLILSDNLLLLFLFWEMTSVCSFFLIGLKNEKKEVREKSKWALYTTVAGGLFLLSGIICLYQIGIESGLSTSESFSINSLSQINNMETSQLFNYAIIFTLIGIASKSALFPFSYWLPLAMAGPTPVSSFLHSATMVKAGLFLGFKVVPIFASSLLWQNVLITIGVISTLHAAIQCLSQRNLKTMLAYSTSCVLGILAIFLGLGKVDGLTSFIVFVLAHAFYKASLFQLIGALDLHCKTMDFFELKKYRIQNNGAFMAAILSCLSMIGIPLTMGFYAKELIYYSAISSPKFFIITTTVFIGNLAMGIQSINFLKVFWPKKDKSVEVKKISTFLIIPALAYSLIAFILAIFPNITKTNYILTNVINDKLNEETLLTLKLWHGVEFPFNIVLLLSALTILGSILGSHIISKKLITINKWISSKSDLSLWPIMINLLEMTLSSFKTFFNHFQNGNLSHYIRTVFFSITCLVLGSLLYVKGLTIPAIEFTTMKITSLVGAFLGLYLAFKSSFQYRVLIYLAISGFFLVFFYGVHSAVDVSMTQLIVESLSLFFILFLIKSIGIREVRKKSSISSYIIAFGFAIMIWLFSWGPVKNYSKSASHYFIENSYQLAKGENIVNVILVDFRALDTMGEVIVVAIAIIGVGALLKKERKYE